MPRKLTVDYRCEQEDDDRKDTIDAEADLNRHRDLLADERVRGAHLVVVSVVALRKPFPARQPQRFQLGLRQQPVQPDRVSELLTLGRAQIANDGVKVLHQSAVAVIAPPPLADHGGRQWLTIAEADCEALRR
jgi:hypothetical protein